MKKIICAYLSIMFLCNCNSDSQKKYSKDDIALTSVKIINHTPNHYIKKDTLITSSSDIRLFSKQFNLLKPVDNVNIKSNKGLYEIILLQKNGAEKVYNVVYSVYDGVIIFDEQTNKTYKNDGLEELILHILQ